MSFEFMLKNVEIEARGIFKIPQSIHNILKEVNEVYIYIYNVFK